MYKDTVKQLLEDVEDLISDILAGDELDGDSDLAAEVVQSLDEAHDALESAARVLK